jgi:drug/metabolite transporter (DMT)-like permease
MVHLILVSLLWAFSFSLIKGRLAGLDPSAIAVVRLTFALLVFLPWLRPRGLPWSGVIRLLGVGAVQFGLMYICYLKAFAHLAAYEVAMFTVFTPFYLALMAGALERRLESRALAAAALAVLGAAVLRWESGAATSSGLIGFLLVQGSNLSFAAGQLAYRRVRAALPAERHDATFFALPYAGGVIATLLFSLFVTDWTAFTPSGSQWWTLAYLGIIASGLGFFGWNLGATRTTAARLAVANNLVVPLAVLMALLLFGEEASPVRLIASAALMGLALFIAEPQRRAGPGSRSSSTDASSPA